MTQQTAVDWLYNKLTSTWYDKKSSSEVLEQAVQMELEQRKEDFKRGYSQGYIDSQCNHIHDGDNFANEQVYLNK